jgi:hypothetical protein
MTLSLPERADPWPRAVENVSPTVQFGTAVTNTVVRFAVLEHEQETAAFRP